MLNERRSARNGWTDVGHGPQRVISVVVAVAVLPLVANRRHAVDEVKDQITIFVLVQTQGDDVVVDLVPIRHVNRAVPIDHCINR